MAGGIDKKSYNDKTEGEEKPTAPKDTERDRDTLIERKNCVVKKLHQAIVEAEVILEKMNKPQHKAE